MTRNSTKKIEGKYTIDDLIKVMSDLRNPVSGCPWDKEQDFKSIIQYTLEEAYEVADAIDRNDMQDLREELGDLLFQSVYHAQMASEIGAFDIYDVINDITEKMIERHPHVFGDEHAANAHDVDKIWDRKKELEKNGKIKSASIKSDDLTQNGNSEPDNVQHKSALDGVTTALPSLLKAQKLQKKAAKVGFEWPDINDALNKLQEEISEFKGAIESGNQDHQAEELGDMLFVIANMARMCGVNAEEALRLCNNKFERRFRALEGSITGRGKKLSDASLEEMQDEWDRQKRIVG